MKAPVVGDSRLIMNGTPTSAAVDAAIHASRVLFIVSREQQIYSDRDECVRDELMLFHELGVWECVEWPRPDPDWSDRARNTRSRSSISQAERASSTAVVASSPHVAATSIARVTARWIRNVFVVMMSAPARRSSSCSFRTAGDGHRVLCPTSNRRGRRCCRGSRASLRREARAPRPRRVRNDEGFRCSSADRYDAHSGHSCQPLQLNWTTMRVPPCVRLRCACRPDLLKPRG